MDTCADKSTVRVSVVVPFYNEEAAAATLVARIAEVMERVGGTYEIVAVNDGSVDGTGEVLAALAEKYPHVVCVDLRRNFGQTAALQAGFDHACGDVIVSLDGDLQHDPAEIPLFLAKIDEGYDLVSGWRVKRADNPMTRRLPSRIANRLLAMASGVDLHDFGTTFKAYRREILQGIRLYGDMHRFIPAVCARLGAKIAEVPITIAPRAAGKSNYGLGRTFRVALDILTMRFVTGYLARPLHFFGKWGLVFGAAGAGILGYGFVRKLFDWHGFRLFEEHGPLMAVGFMCVVASMFFLATGLIGEMLSRVYFESTGARTYAVRRVVRKSS